MQHATVFYGHAVNRLASLSTRFPLGTPGPRPLATAVGPRNVTLTGGRTDGSAPKDAVAPTVPAGDELDITLDGSVSYFLQVDRILVALRNGDLCV